MKLDRLDLVLSLAAVTFKEASALAKLVSKSTPFDILWTVRRALGKMSVMK
jgi:hypothetical protein